MGIDGHSIDVYWCLLMGIILVIIGGYSIGGYWCLAMVTIFMTIGAYSINGYFVSGYWWLLMLLY
jgi:hypothetical protein